MVSEPDDRDRPERVVGLAVTAAVEAVSCGLSRRSGDGASPAECGERCFCRATFGVVAGRNDELGCNIGTNAELGEQCRGGQMDEFAELSVEFVDFLGLIRTGSDVCSLGWFRQAARA